jgi:putative sigma-54 modulation protein
MKITIQTPGFKAQKKLTDFVQQHVEKLSRVSDRILESQVCLKVEKSGTRENKVCEIKILIPGNDLFATRHNNTFEEAVLRTIKAIEHQMKRWKEAGHGKVVHTATTPFE